MLGDLLYAEGVGFAYITMTICVRAFERQNSNTSSNKIHLFFHIYCCKVFFGEYHSVVNQGMTMTFTALQLFKNLSDETRLSIVLLLREMGELCVCDLCTALDRPQPKISRHLAMLRESGLLLDRKQGKWVHYRLSPHVPSWAAQVIEQAWLSQQDDLRAIARKLTNCSGGGKAVCS